MFIYRNIYISMYRIQNIIASVSYAPDSPQPISPNTIDTNGTAPTQVSVGNTNEQNQRDFEQFQQACRKGRLRARPEADFAADHLP